MDHKPISEMTDEEFAEFNKKMYENIKKEQYQYVKEKYGEEYAREFMDFQSKLLENKEFRKKWRIREFLNEKIIQFYLNESIKLSNNQQYLPLIFSAGFLSEALAYSLLEDLFSELGFEFELDDKRLFTLLKLLLNGKYITKEQYQLFNNIKEIRNKHVHPNFGKIYDENKDLQKELLSDDNALIDKYLEIVKKNALKIIKLFKKLIKSLII